MFFQKRNDIRKVFLESTQYQNKYGMSGFLDDLFDDVLDGVTGLVDAISGALQATINAIAHIGETIALVVRAAIGDVSWNEVLGELGEVFRDIGSVMVFLNPANFYYDLLSQSRITGHAFNELDKFTGGFITNARNVSTLPARAMRGDPISKQELIKDALFGLQVVSLVIGGPIALGFMVGTWTGREVCSKQTEARDACMVAFQIVGAAAGSYASAASNIAWGTAADTAKEYASGSISAAESAAFSAGDEAYKQFVQRQLEQAALQNSTSFLTHLAHAGTQYLTTAGLTEATKHVATLCQSVDLLGDRECEIVAQVAANYVRSEIRDQPWEEFLAQEVARIGAEELMLQWFPEESKEARAIRRQWQVNYIDVPVDQTVVVQKSISPATILLAAGGAALFLVGAGS